MPNLETLGVCVDKDKEGAAFHWSGDVTVQRVPQFQGSGPTGHGNLGRRLLRRLTANAAARCLLHLLVDLVPP